MGKSKSNVDQLNALPGNLSALNAALAGKQAALVSGANIKTVNGNSLLGSGDLVIAGGGGGGSGDVVGPASATDGAVALFDGATGKLLKVGGTLGTAAFTPSTNYLTPSAIGVTVQGYSATLASWAGKTVPAGDAVGTTDTQTLSGKTVTGLKETRVAMAANNIDLATGNVFTKTISGAATLTVSNVPAAGATASFILDLTNGGSAAITWWSGVKWAGGAVPTLTAAGRDVLGFFTHDGGTTWTGLVMGKDVK